MTTAFSTIVGQYNSTLLTLSDAQHSILALDAKSRLITDHTTSSISIGDGTDLLDILVHDATFAASSKTGVGILAVRKDAEGTLVSADGDLSFLQIDERGRLRVVSSESVGIEADLGCDEAGTTDGEIGSVGTATWVDVVDIPVAASTTYNLNAVDGSADRLCQFRLVIWDASQDPGDEVVKYIRKFPVTENVGVVQLVFPRPVEVAGAADISIKLQAIRLRAGTDASVSGGINGFLEP